jgi:hypothetical protein
MQSALTAYHKAELLRFVMPEINADLIIIMFDNFNNVFGSGKKVTLEFRSKGNLPTIKITPDATLLSFSAELAIMNPINPTLDALRLQTLLTLDLQPALQPLDLSLSATLKNLKLKVTGVTALYKQDKLSVERVDTTINAFLENLKKGVNEVIQHRGLKLPIPEGLDFEKYSKNHGFEAREGYYVLKADAKLEPDENDNLQNFL